MVRVVCRPDLTLGEVTITAFLTYDLARHFLLPEFPIFPAENICCGISVLLAMLGLVQEGLKELQ